MILCVCGHSSAEHVSECGPCLEDSCRCNCYEPEWVEVKPDGADQAQEADADEFAAMFQQEMEGRL